MNNMEDELILFETAKLAKELGFKEECYVAYDEEGQKDYAIDFTREPKFNYESIENYQANGYVAYLAPTQSLLQKWLREKYSINMKVEWSYEVNMGYSYYIAKHNNYHNIPLYSNRSYETYEEALEAALTKGLNIIKDEINKGTN